MKQAQDATPKVKVRVKAATFSGSHASNPTPFSGIKGVERLFNVNACAHAQRDYLHVDLTDGLKLHDKIKAGLPLRRIREYAERVGVSDISIANACGLSRSTYLRKLKRSPNDRLNPIGSDAIARYTALFSRAVEVFGDEESAKNWIQTPQVGLGGAKPIDLAETSFGALEVEKLLTRIDLGVYA
jgi:putative toxin-antitoxin system antitoxin component (TIGR02293 family)